MRSFYMATIAEFVKEEMLLLLLLLLLLRRWRASVCLNFNCLLEATAEG